MAYAAVLGPQIISSRLPNSSSVFTGETIAVLTALRSRSHVEGKKNYDLF